MLRGILISLLASLLFGYMYYFSTLLKPLSGTDIFGYRMLFTFPFVALSVVLSIAFSDCLSPLSLPLPLPSFFLLPFPVVPSAAGKPRPFELLRTVGYRGAG